MPRRLLRGLPARRWRCPPALPVAAAAALALVLALALTLPAPGNDGTAGDGTAEDGTAGDGMAGVMACFAGLPPEEFAGRFEAFAEAQGFDARMASLCAAGDPASAEAFAAEVERGFLAADPEAAAVRRCLADLTAAATVGAGAGEVCDAPGG